jgi:predicted DCC family thiol-disulfide oxidoreductase YuxK
MNQIIFFDGVCVLCNGFVDFVLTRDKHRIFRFAPLQGETAKRMLPEIHTQDVSTVVLWNQGQISLRSDAALIILSQLGGFWYFAKLGWIFPAVVRDGVYRFIASQRYKCFGKRDSCRLPKPDEREVFLD